MTELTQMQRIQLLRRQLEARNLQSSGNAATTTDATTGQTIAARPPRVEVQEAQGEVRSQRGVVFENLIGSGEVDTPGERAGEVVGDIANSLGSGVVRGAVGLADLVGNAGNSAGDIAEAISVSVFGENPLTEYVSEAMWPMGRNTVAEGVRASGGGGALDYQPQTNAGEYAQNVGEFVPGAVLAGGVGAVPAFAVAPGLTSEAAGQFAEGRQIPEGVPLVGGMDAEPFARTAGALIGPSVFNATSRMVTPNPADPARVAAARALQREGVTTTAGQRTGSIDLRRRETEAGRTADILEQQSDDFTSAVLQRIGLTDDVARSIRSTSPETMPSRAQAPVLDALRTRIGAQFNRLTGRNTLSVDDNLRTALSDITQAYDDVAETAMPGILRAVTDRLGGGLTSISGRNYQNWRSRVSRLTRSQDPAIREAAIDTIGALDDAMARSMQSAGNTQDMQAFAQARAMYRDYLVVERAASASGEAAASGLISPAQLWNAARSIQGRRVAVSGQSDLASLARSGQTAMGQPRSSDTAQWGRALGAFQGSSSTGIAAGLTANALGASPEVAAAIGVGGALAPMARTSLSGSRAGQAYLGNQLLTQRASPNNPASLNVLAQILAQSENRQENQ